LLRTLKNGDLISLHQRFDLDAVMRDIEVKRATAFPACRPCGSPSPVCPISTSAICRRWPSQARRAAAGRGRQRSNARPSSLEERLGHDRDLFARHRPSAGGPEKPGSIGLMLPASRWTWFRSTIRSR
jgi:long-chain acyl-CoA synthetase